MVTPDKSIENSEEDIFDADLPIEDSSKDIFNRSDYANNLAKALLKSHYKNSFVVGLYGSWGSGKTSLCNMILEKVNEEIENRKNKIPYIAKYDINLKQAMMEEQLINFQFNPWLCSDANQLTRQFFMQLGSTLQIKHFPKVANLILNYAEMAGHITSIFQPLGKYLSKGMSCIKKIYTIYEKEKNTLQNMKKNIITELELQNIKLFITIDDIDRLSEQEIVTVFQLVKALGDFPNTIYFLCFDYEIVTTALDNIHRNKGKEYLEKIVQLPVFMPQYKFIELKKIVTDSLKKIINEDYKNIITDDENLQRWIDYEFAIMQYMKSVRDIHRLFNTYSLVLLIVN